MNEFPLIAAPFTPMRADGSVCLDAVERQVESLIATGVNGAFVCGTTGEGPSLTTAERMELAARWAAVRTPEFRLFIQVGHTALPDAQALARHAAQIGADAIAAVPPYYFKPASVEQLVDYFAALASFAPHTPFYYYHIPVMSGVTIRVRDFLERASGRIPNLAGVKFTHEDLVDYAQCLAFEDSHYDVLFGRDEFLLAALAFGGRGAVGSAYNYDAPTYRRLINAFDAGNLPRARAEQSAAQRLVDVMNRHGGLPAGKALMKLCHGIDCGPVRPPLRSLTPAQQKTLQEDLGQIRDVEPAGVICGS